MKDIIDERNEKEKIKKSIIKFWNVNYMPVSQEQIAANQPEEEAQRLAEESEQNAFDVAEENADNLEKDEFYNATTGSYSGGYGRGKVSDVEKGQIDMILREKKDAVRNLIEQGIK